MAPLHYVAKFDQILPSGNLDTRMAHLNVSLDVNYKQFGASSRAGFNTKSSSDATSTSREYSFLLEQEPYSIENILV